MTLDLVGHKLKLLYQKALHDQSTDTLIISDIHLGKIEHFRSSGIALPAKAGFHSFIKLDELIESVKPHSVVFLGDLFHSLKNTSFFHLQTLISKHHETKFALVIGNHDIFSENEYGSLHIKVIEELHIGNLWCTHEPMYPESNQIVNIAGHLHPGIRLEGKAKQSLRLSCFYFYKNSLVLPAFGYFTGRYLVEPNTESRIFAITDQSIFEVP